MALGEFERHRAVLFAGHARARRAARRRRRRGIARAARGTGARRGHRHAGRGRHFLPAAPPESIGHQALAVNLSDLAAMGAEPAWALLALSLPEPDTHWLEGFARGFHDSRDWQASRWLAVTRARSARRHRAGARVCACGAALRRDGARPGDVSTFRGLSAWPPRASTCCATAGEQIPIRRWRRYRFAEPRLALGF